MENINIITRFKSLSKNFPGRVYIHPSNFKKTYTCIKGAIQHYRDVVQSNELTPALDRKLDFTNSIMWATEKGDKMIDFFGYSGVKPWPGNPDIFSWVTKNGLIVPSHPDNINEITCEQGSIILGNIEAPYRRDVTNLEQYLKFAPLPCPVNFKETDLASAGAEKMIADIWFRG